ncbi:MAG: pentapeptide repeat-containing protein [Candidatus Margulisiibacteriota bacterium]
MGIAKNYDQPDATWEIAKLRKSDYYRNGELCSQGLSQMIVGRLVEHKDLVSEYGDSTESALAAIRCFMLGDTAGFNRNVHSLRNVDLDLSGAYLRGAMIDGMDLTSVSLIKANLTNAVLRGVSLRGTFLAGAKMAGAVLIGCDFAPETVDMAKMRNVTFVRSKVPSTPEFAAFANKYGIKIVD